MSDEKAAILKRLINKGKFHKASRRAIVMDEGCESAAFYFHAALAEQLDPSGSATQANWYQVAARNAEGYSPLIEVDLMRDQALAALRRGMPSTAATLAKDSNALLEKAQETVDHLQWRNRAALGNMVAGRIYLAHGKPKIAVTLHREAHKFFQGLGEDADRQWKLNNGFHWLRAEAAAGSRASYRFRKFDWVINTDVNRTRRMRTRLLQCFGRAGYWLDDLVIRRLFG
jgi:hypothetical protein